MQPVVFSSHQNLSWCNVELQFIFCKTLLSSALVWTDALCGSTLFFPAGHLQTSNVRHVWTSIELSYKPLEIRIDFWRSGLFSFPFSFPFSSPPSFPLLFPFRFSPSLSSHFSSLLLPPHPPLPFPSPHPSSSFLSLPLPSSLWFLMSCSLPKQREMRWGSVLAGDGRPAQDCHDVGDTRHSETLLTMLCGP